MTQQFVICGDFLSFGAEEFGGDDWSVITDPPYSPHVHANATSCGTGDRSRIRTASGHVGARHRDLGFDPLTETDRGALALVAARCQWTAVFTDIEGAHHWRECLPRYVRTIPWLRWSMAQLSGDRPPQAREDIITAGDVEDALLGPVADLVLGYRAKGRMFYNGPGNLTHFDEKALRGSDKHKCEKPLDLCCRLVEYFSHEGDTIFDPYAGSAAIGLACRELGRNYVGIERDPEWAARASARLLTPLSERDAGRVADYLARKAEIDRGNLARAAVTAKTVEKKKAARAAAAAAAKLTAEQNTEPVL